MPVAVQGQEIINLSEVTCDILQCSEHLALQEETLRKLTQLNRHDKEGYSCIHLLAHATYLYPCHQILNDADKPLYALSLLTGLPMEVE